MHNKIIGVSGCARTGKDTFFNILKKYIPEVEQVALAFELKKDLDDFVKSKLMRIENQILIRNRRFG